MSTIGGWLFAITMIIICYQLEARNMHKTTGLLGLLLLFVFWFTASNSFLLFIFGIALCYESISALFGKALFGIFASRKKPEDGTGDIK